MHPMPETGTELPDIPHGMPLLHYEKPALGLNYWLLDEALPNALDVSKRCFNSGSWKLGYPHTSEKWPGMRSKKALKKDELEKVEAWVKSVTGAKRLWTPELSGGNKVDCNVAQLVGKNESGALPHTDSRNLCHLAAVIYLSPKPDPKAGTTFYRLRYPNGAAGGNIVLEPHINLKDALKVQRLPPEAWYEDVQIDNKFNRMLLYKANLVHSATAYFGQDKRDRRLTALFFWMAEF